MHAAGQFAHGHGYLGLFVFLLLEECGVPLLFLPGDLLVAWAGFQSSIGQLEAAQAFLVIALAVAMGSSVLYTLSYRFGSSLVGVLARWTRIKPERMTQAEGRVRRWGMPAVIIGRLIPGLRTPTTVVSGTVRLPYRVFLPGTMLAAIIWTGFYFYAGIVLGRAWSQVDDYLLSYWNAHVPQLVIVGVGLLAVLGTTVLIKKLAWRSGAP